MKVAIASDHAAFDLKEQIKAYLEKKGFEILDFGADSAQSMDYPDTIKLAARSVSKGESGRAVVLCGSGVGASIVANKIKGIRAALCMDEYTAEYSRRHNNANVLVLPGRRRTMDDISRYLDIWFSTEYEGGRHQTRLDKIALIEKEESR
jgi:ribose 5-phosphate isomerase B